MKKKYIPLLALALAACQEGTITPDLATSSEMSFNVLAPGAVTKVTGDVFDAMDEIGLYVTDYADDKTPMPLQISGNRANNVSVSFDGTSWTPEKTVMWGTGRSDVYAYYPYIQEISDVDSQYFEVSEDQTGDGYEASDLLWAKAVGVRQTDGAVSLQMSHIMSKLTVKIVAGEDYVGSLPEDASVLLHSTVTGARVDMAKGSVSKDPYSGAKSIRMKNLGIRAYDGYDAVVFETIVVPQMLESSVPLLEINSKSVSYLLEDSFNFRPGVAYTYTATLNTSTTAIKVDIGCELEDWNSTGDGGSGEGDDGPGSGDQEDDGKNYTDLSAAGTANCYLVQKAGDYKFRSVLGNTDATVGNVKSVEVLWESFGTDEMPNVGDLIASVSYKNGYIRFSTPETFRDGNAVIAAKNSSGTILWSWHIWCAEEGWQEQVYYNDAGTMMDRNLGATSAAPGDVGALGLMYQWGRKDPFLGSSSISSDEVALSTGNWGRDYVLYPDSYNYPMSLCTETQYVEFPKNAWGKIKTVYDPCPLGWKVPEGGVDGIWRKAAEFTEDFHIIASVLELNGHSFDVFVQGNNYPWYPAAGYLENYKLQKVGFNGFYWASPDETGKGVYFAFSHTNEFDKAFFGSDTRAYPIRCQKD